MKGVGRDRDGSSPPLLGALVGGELTLKLAFGWQYPDSDGLRSDLFLRTFAKLVRKRQLVALHANRQRWRWRLDVTSGTPAFRLTCHEALHLLDKHRPACRESCHGPKSASCMQCALGWQEKPSWTHVPCMPVYAACLCSSV